MPPCFHVIPASGPAPNPRTALPTAAPAQLPQGHHCRAAGPDLPGRQARQRAGACVCRGLVGAGQCAGNAWRQPGAAEDAGTAGARSLRCRLLFSWAMPHPNAILLPAGWLAGWMLSGRRGPPSTSGSGSGRRARWRHCARSAKPAGARWVCRWCAAGVWHAAASTVCRGAPQFLLRMHVAHQLLSCRVALPLPSLPLLAVADLQATPSASAATRSGGRPLVWTLREATPTWRACQTMWNWKRQSLRSCRPPATAWPPSPLLGRRRRRAQRRRHLVRCGVLGGSICGQAL